MALQHNTTASDNDIGIAVNNCYTVVSEATIDKTPRYSAPAEEGGEPVLRTKHTLRFKTTTYVNQAAANENKNMIAQHSYEEDLPASYSNNIIAYCYTWLKSNVSLYDSATDV